MNISSKPIEISLFPFQLEVLNSLKEFEVVTLAIGRRMGKSYIGALASVLHCLKATDKPRRVLIIAPTSDMAKESYWSQLKEFLHIYRPFVYSVKERDREVEFKNGSLISLKSADKPDTLRGISGRAAVSFVIMDEFSFLRDAEKLFEEVIMPYRANSNTKCRFLCISTPKGTNNFFHQMYLKGLDQEKFPDHKSLHYTCYDAQPSLKEAFDLQRKSVSDRTFKQEYLAEFIGSGNNAFYAFDRLLHIDPSIKDVQHGETLSIGLDANYGIMANIIARVKLNESKNAHTIEVIKEVQGKHKNVEQLITDYNNIYRTHLNCSIVVCPDASMSQKAYSASIGQTGIHLLKNAGWLVKAEKRNPTFIDSVQAVNQAFVAGDGTVNLRIHPSCVQLITAIESQQWSETEGHKLDKTSTSKLGHIQDCLRYLVYQYRTVVPTITMRRTNFF